MTNKKRAIFAAFADSLTGNRGAVSMLESAIDHLTSDEYPGKINVFSVYPRTDKKLPRAPRLKLYSGTPVNLAFKLIPLSIFYRLLEWLNISAPHWVWGREMQALIDTDVCLMIGGTTFTDEKPFKIPYNVACLLPAIILGKKSIMYSQTLGPFETLFNRICAKWCLSRMNFIIPRGPSSLKNVQSLQLSTKVQYYPDAAFSLLVGDKVIKGIKEKYSQLLRGKTVVGISTNTIVEKKCKKLGIDHHGAWVQFINYLRSKGHLVLLIPHSIRQNARTRHNNDLITINEILSRLSSKNGIHVVDEPYNCKELRAVVGLTDYYVASRFHSMISALCTYVPVAVFGWGIQKYREVLEEFELEFYCHDAADLTGKNLIGGFEEIVRDADEIKRKIKKHLPRIKRLSEMNHQTAWQLLY